ncbi:MAG: sigma-70 family RNA polymerase sigma factor [Myxococcota bacterium]
MTAAALPLASPPSLFPCGRRKALREARAARVGSATVAAEQTDEDLMRAYVAGDHAAFQQLFDRYAPIVFGMTRRHLRNEELAQEITQQTFFRLHSARNDFRLDSKLRPWLLTIAMNLVREHWRRGKRRKMVELDPETKAAPQAERSRMELDERSQLLHAALQQLPESQREVVELHWFQERPYKEVAEIVGSSEGAVRVRAHRAYGKLKKLLKAEVAD